MCPLFTLVLSYSRFLWLVAYTWNRPAASHVAYGNRRVGAFAREAEILLLEALPAHGVIRKSWMFEGCAKLPHYFMFRWTM